MSDPSIANERMEIAVSPTGQAEEFKVEVTTIYVVSGVGTADEALRETFLVQ